MGRPFTLQQAQQLCQYFHRDMRKAILHLQLMLSWQPSDPMTLLSVGDSDAVPRSLSSKREGEMGVGEREGDEVGCKERLKKGREGKEE